MEEGWGEGGRGGTEEWGQDDGDRRTGWVGVTATEGWGWGGDRGTAAG